MQFNRRQVLIGASAAAGVALAGAMPAFAKPVASIIGDGVHDDAPGLNVLFGQKGAVSLGKGIQLRWGFGNDGKTTIAGGRFLLRSTIYIPNTWRMADCELIAAPAFYGSFIVEAEGLDWPFENTRFQFARENGAPFALGMVNAPQRS